MATEGGVPRGSMLGSFEMAALAAAGVTGGFVFIIQSKNAYSEGCCKNHGFDDATYGKSIDLHHKEDIKTSQSHQAPVTISGHGREAFKTEHCTEILATSGKYHQLAIAEKADETMQTAQDAFISGVNRLHEASKVWSTTKKSFKALALQLDAKNKRDKLQLARLLHKLHELASESSTLEGASGLSSLGSSVKAESETSEEEWSNGKVLHLKDPKHLNTEKAMKYIEALRDGASFDVESLLALFSVSTNILKHDPSLIDLCDKETVTVVGDLHGSLQCLTNTLSEVGDIHEDKAVVFNGDFVDRGPQSLEVILTLLLLKLAFPDRVFLTRGNHEDSFLSTVYGTEDEFREKYGDEKLDLLWGKLSNIFSALPICCVTCNSAIMHGGLPSDTFRLDEVRAISADERFRVRSVVEPRNDTEQLLQNILWSDPVDEDGIQFNEARGAGNMFGADVARKFLDRHGLLYLIRSHEPWEQGWTAMDCGDGRFVVTVFSNAAYDGCESGAVVHLHSDGRILPTQVPQLKPPVKTKRDTPVLEVLVEMISSNRCKLADAFNEVAPESAGGALTREQWAAVMAKVLDLPEVDWISIQPSLAPITLEETTPSSCDKSAEGKTSSHVKLQDTGMLNWRRFLDLHSISLPPGAIEKDSTISESSVENLFANHAKLLTVFKFLDTNCNGRVDKDEFRAGMDLLHKRLPEDELLPDPDTIFSTLDLDGNGEIELDEFSEGFSM